MQPEFVARTAKGRVIELDRRKATDDHISRFAHICYGWHCGWILYGRQELLWMP